MAVVAMSDVATGLKGFIVIHNTNLGPAVGGTRFRHYKNESEALTDALRLSKAMTYKCAMASVPYGGGKAVIMAPKRMTPKQKKALLVAYTKRLALLDGHFFTGEDVGIDVQDIETLAAHSDSIIGRPNIGGMPAYWAAVSVAVSMEAALHERFGSKSFNGRTFAVKGLGNVGMELCRIIHEKGGTVFAADIDPKRAQLARKKFPGIHIVSSARIHTQHVDVFAPCALGNELNEKTIKELNCAIVCGAANNQLYSAADGVHLYKRNILYIPDYVANAGGLINVVAELHADGYSEKRVAARVQHVGRTVREILARSRKRRLPTSVIADEIAQQRFYKSKRS